MKSLINLLAFLLKKYWPSLGRFLVRMRTIYSILPKRQRLMLLGVWATMFSSSIIGLLSIISIVPFLTVALLPDVVDQYEWVDQLKGFINVDSTSELVVVLGILSFCILIFNHVYQYFITLYKWKVSDELRVTLFRNLFSHYMSASYDLHLRNNSSLLLNNITHKGFSVLDSLVYGSLSLVHQIMYIILAIIILALNNFVWMLCSVSILLSLTTFYILKKRQAIKMKQEATMTLGANIPRMVLESFQSIEDIKISGREKYFSEKVTNLFAYKILLGRQMNKISYWFTPIVEMVVYGLITAIIIIFVLFNENDKTFLPSFALFALILYRLMPRFNSLFGMYTNLRKGVMNFDFIQESFLLSYKNTLHEKTDYKLSLKNKIELKNISYKYANAVLPALDDVSLEITKGSKIGFVGHSGSGKTTLMKILLGLINNNQGEIYIDKKRLDENILPEWQNVIGYVSQQITLLEATIAQNISLELDDNNIDTDRIWKLLKIVGLDELINDLPGKINALVGERGVNFSGGQRQRLIIARALYREPEVIVFDEATSALDSITEDKIINNINHTLKDHTVIMVAHRISTVIDSDIIFCMENGKIVDKGTYDELTRNSELFRKLAKIKGPVDNLQTTEI